MSGCIIGAYGYQRSGKTLIAYLIAEKYRALGCKVYSNMIVKEWTTIKSLNEIPLDYKPKVLLLDELYYFMDSRQFQNNAKSSIFFTTIGKQNILFIYTAINPDMIEKRIREQTNYMYIVKPNKDFIYYKIIDVQRSKEKVHILEKSAKLFESVKYDTQQIPEYIDTNIDFDKNFIKNIKENINIKGVIEL